MAIYRQHLPGMLRIPDFANRPPILLTIWESYVILKKKGLVVHGNKP